ncbi:MAG TPA: hypothetical protein VJJ52_02125 [Candidatus Nanoarchaeia archaeon]|nr:hypothetical protein [Candidatus Nanoarchaeia archaeon]
MKINKFVLYSIFIGTALLIGTLYFLYLWSCEDDWCFQYEWQVKKNTQTFGDCANREYPVSTQADGSKICRIGGKEYINNE